MSVEIEVGPENATKVRPLSEEVPLEKEEPKGLANPKMQRLAILGGVVLIAVLVGLFLYYHNRESTDDAEIDGHITPIAAKIYGRVAEVLVKDNQTVKAGQLLVKIDPRDYQAAVDQAQAALELAESEARSAGVDVPRTAENVASGTSKRGCRALGSAGGFGERASDVRAGANGGSRVCAGEREQEHGQRGPGAGRFGALQAIDGER